MNFRPIARGLFVCDQVTVDPATHDITLINCFTRKRVTRFPSPLLRFSVFTALTGGLGPVMMRVMVSRVVDNRVVYWRDHRAVFRDRVIETRFILRVTDVQFPDPGQYVVEILADGEWVAQTTISVSL